jgi:hypothetical protein
MSLVEFFNFNQERNARPREEVGYEHLCDKLEEIYPEVSFKCIEYRIFAGVKACLKGSLVERIGFVSRQIPFHSTTVSFGFDSIKVFYRADGIGVIKNESWYEFFEHSLDLRKIKKECYNDLGAIGDYLSNHFLEEVSDQMEDPFFDPDGEGDDLYFETGSQDELDRLMRLFILTEPAIEAHNEEDVAIYAAMEDDAACLGDEYQYCSARLKELAEIAISENYPVGWRWEYNDGAYYRRSGYDRQAEVISWNIGDVIEQASAREKMAARRELREYLAARNLDIRKFDELAKGQSAA